MNVLLVISGNKTIRESLRNALPPANLLIEEPTLDSACRRLVSIQADVILLDDGPALGGPALSTLRSVAPNIPIVVLSSRGDVITQAHLLKAGADHVLVKPFECSALLSAVDMLAAQRTAIDQPSSGNNGYNHPHNAVIGQHQMALRWLSRASIHADNPLRLSQSLVESAADIFDAARCAVVLEGGDGVRVMASQGVPDAITRALRLSYASGLMRYFDAHATLIDRENAQQFPDVVKELQLLHACMAAPLLRNGRVFGAIALGEKASGYPYTQEERELLSLVARTTSIAFERARMHSHNLSQRTDLENVLTHLQAGVVVVLADKTIGMMNRHAETLLELRASDMLGKSVQKLGSAFADTALRTFAEGEARRSCIRDAATDTLLDLQASPIAGGSIVLLFSPAPAPQAAAGDIAQSPFWEYLSERVAQEIKNPMVAINTFAQLLPRKYDSEDFRDTFCQVVQREVSRINAVVETLFAFARNPKLSIERCNVNDTVQNVLKTFEEQLASRTIRVEMDLDPEVAEAHLDQAQFSQAMQNVVQNSLDAMSDGGRLKVSTKKQDGQAEIRISDNGPGVPVHEENLVFLPFYSSKEKGMGLGLTLAQRIMQEHHGELKLAANAEGGAAFSFRLPVPERGEGTTKQGTSHENDSGD
ncbi:MAG TPA: ATP-binding protein [Candidatus Hydrogenedentes bacterium]|nr:ATP-binding protein [Candidatus Hydrogenedentota bacterium]